MQLEAGFADFGARSFLELFVPLSGKELISLLVYRLLFGPQISV